MKLSFSNAVSTGLLAYGALQLAQFPLPVNADNGSTASAATNLFFQIGLTAAAEDPCAEAALEVGQFFSGIALNRLGIGSNQGASMTDIYNELVDIENTLTEINENIEKLDQDLQQFDCNVMTAKSDPDITTIETFAQYYNDYVDGTQSIFHLSCDTTKYGPNICLESWADAVLDHHSGVGHALQSINNVLGGEGNPSGSIGTCMDRFPISINNTDTTLFGNMYNYLEYYYQYQSLGALLVVEANRFKAWQRAGFPDFANPSDPSSYNEICTDIDYYCDGDSDCECDVGIYCVAAYAIVHDAYGRIASQYNLVGAPYTNQDMVTYYMGPGTDISATVGRVFPRSLTDFTASSNKPKNRPETSACPDPVPSPLISESGVCGVTTMDAVNSQAAYPAELVAFNRSEWEIATSAEWYSFTYGLQKLNSTIGDFKSKPFHEYLSYLGLKDMESKIFYMKDQFHTVVVGENTYPSGVDSTNWIFQCFADTENVPKPSSDSPVYCQGQQDVDHLMKKDTSGSFKKDHVLYYYKTMKANSANYPSERQYWYGGKQKYDTSKGNLYWEILEAGNNGCTETNGQCAEYGNPGYLHGHTHPQGSSLNIQYTLPVIMTEKLQCTDGNVQRNPRSHAIQMCGTDKQEFFDALIPPPPASAVDPTVTCSASIMDMLNTQGALSTAEFLSTTDVTSASAEPSQSSSPTMVMTDAPSAASSSASPSMAPSSAPSTAATESPTSAPSASPSTATDSPSVAPSSASSASPSASPTAAPSPVDGSRNLRGKSRKL